MRWPGTGGSRRVTDHSSQPLDTWSDLLRFGASRGRGYRATLTPKTATDIAPRGTDDTSGIRVFTPPLTAAGTGHTASQNGAGRPQEDCWPRARARRDAPRAPMVLGSGRRLIGLTFHGQVDFHPHRPARLNQQPAREWLEPRMLKGDVVDAGC